MIMVAASNASQQSRKNADFLCTGTGDEVVINEAIAALPAGVGGMVNLSEGTFNIAGSIKVDQDNVALTGDGYGTYIIPQSASVSMPAMVLVGATRNVNFCMVMMLRMYGGRDAGAATGNAIQMNGSNLHIHDVYIRQAASNGIAIGSIDTTTAFEHHLNNVYVRAPGNDGVVLTKQVADSELVRVLAVGGQQPVSETSVALPPGAFGRYGFNLAGTNIKLNFCHAYFNLWGLYSTSWGLQVFGGEYETNQIGGIYQGNNSPRGVIIGATFYDNISSGIMLDTNVRMQQLNGNVIRTGGRSTAPLNAIELNGSSQNIVNNNVIAQVAAGGNGIYLHGSASGNLLSGNLIKPEGDSPTGNGGSAVTMTDTASLNEIIGNTMSGSVREVASSAGTPSHNTVNDVNVIFPGAEVTLIGPGSVQEPPETPWQPSDNNLLMAAWDPGVSPANTQLTAGVLYLVRLTARDDVTVSTLWWNVFTAGSGSSHGSFSGIYDASGALVAKSSDIGSSLTTAGPVAVTLAASYAMFRGQSVWAAILSNLATAQPSLAKGTGGQVLAEAGGLQVSQARFATNGSGLTTLPTAITPSRNTFTAQTLWAGAS